MSPIEQQNAMFGLVADINDVLKKNGISKQILLADLTITDASVNDLFKPSPKLSDAITDVVI